MEGFRERAGGEEEEEQQQQHGDGDAVTVREPVLEAGEGAEGEVLHHKPLRHHARLLERLPLN